MLDIKFIRENTKEVKKAAKHKGVDVDVDQVLKLDEKRRELQQKLDQLKAEKNKASKKIGGLARRSPDDNQDQGGDKESIIKQMKKVDEQAAKLEKDFKKTETEYLDLMYKIPNIYSDDTPKGKDESDNKIIRQWGDLPKFNFEPKDHVELGKALDIIDTETSAKVSGSRFSYLKGGAAMLEFALVQHAMQTLTNEDTIKKIIKQFKLDMSSRPFVPVVPPQMIRPEVYSRMGRLSEADKEERYHLEKDDTYLIGSAEHTLGPMHMDQTLKEPDLPLRYVGFSTSFRREAGTYGKDTKGILRVHQFDKIEMESFTTPENSLKEQDFFVAIQEYLMRSLELPYQVVQICTGDMGGPDFRQIDIETWLPGQDKYRETHTSDLMTDYQARRLNTRVKRQDKTEFAHMNDATAFAIGRTLIAILENYQQADGSIKIPKVLVPYVGFDIITAK
jgi:seryl-tRNA synthetase